MPAPDFETFKVVNQEQSSSTKYNNFVQAVEDEFSDIDTDQITQGGATTGQALIWNGSAWAPASIATVGYGTALPGSPVDAQEFILVDSTTAPTYQWRFRYVAAKASNKWVFIGGPPIHDQIETAETTASTTYAALTTAGPSIALPVAGDYIVSHGFKHDTSSGSQNTALMSYDIGGTGAVDADAVSVLGLSAANSAFSNLSRAKKKTGLTVITLTAKYKVGGGTQGFSMRWMEVTPIAIGG